MKNKKETLEEAAEKAYRFEADPNFPDEREYREFIRIFKRGANWQAKQMYSEEDLKTAFLDGWQLRSEGLTFSKAKKKWFEEFLKR